jgi:hypothetical protein
LRAKLIGRFTSDERRRRNTNELMNLRQKDNESVGEYAGRFRKMLRRGLNIPDALQVNFFIRGLKSELIEQTRYGNPANLNDAITTAKNVEQAKEEVMQSKFGTTGVTEK